MTFFEKHIFICENERPDYDPRGCCKARGGAEFTSALKKLCKDAQLSGKVRVNKAGCLDFCAYGAVAVVYPEGVWYQGLTAADAQEVFDQHIVSGNPVERLLLKKDQPPTSLKERTP